LGITVRSGHTTITEGYHQTNRKTDTGKTLKRWPVLVDHFRLIHLMEENKQKTYPFSAVKEWRYNLSTTRERSGMNKELDRTHDFRESGFYISVDDVQYPEWRVMFFPQKGDFNSQEGIRDTELQLKRWMHIFAKVLNKE